VSILGKYCEINFRVSSKHPQQLTCHLLELTNYIRMKASLITFIWKKSLFKSDNWLKSYRVLREKSAFFPTVGLFAFMFVDVIFIFMNGKGFVKNSLVDRIPGF
jgi:hypothetical protein